MTKVWGGDGMVQRWIDASAGSEVLLGEKIKKFTVEIRPEAVTICVPARKTSGPRG